MMWPPCLLRKAVMSVIFKQAVGRGGREVVADIGQALNALVLKWPPGLAVSVGRLLAMQHRLSSATPQHKWVITTVLSAKCSTERHQTGILCRSGLAP